MHTRRAKRPHNMDEALKRELQHIEDRRQQIYNQLSKDVTESNSTRKRKFRSTSRFDGDYRRRSPSSHRRRSPSLYRRRRYSPQHKKERRDQINDTRSHYRDESPSTQRRGRSRTRDSRKSKESTSRRIQSVVHTPKYSDVKKARNTTDSVRFDITSTYKFDRHLENRYTDEEDSRTSSIQTRNKDLTQHKQEENEISSQVHDEENRYTDEEHSRTSSIQTRDKDLTQHKQEENEISSQVHDEDERQNLIQENSEILVLSAEDLDDVTQNQENSELNSEEECSQPHAEDDGETQQIQDTQIELNTKSEDETLVQEHPETSGFDTETVSKTQIEEKPSWADAVQETVNAVCGIISDSESSEEETTKPRTPTRPADKSNDQFDFTIHPTYFPFAQPPDSHHISLNDLCMSLEQNSSQFTNQEEFINPVQQQELDTESTKLDEGINNITHPTPPQEQNPAKKRKYIKKPTNDVANIKQFYINKFQPYTVDARIRYEHIIEELQKLRENIDRQVITVTSSLDNIISMFGELKLQ